MPTGDMADNLVCPMKRPRWTLHGPISRARAQVTAVAGRLDMRGNRGTVKSQKVGGWGGLSAMLILVSKDRLRHNLSGVRKRRQPNYLPMVWCGVAISPAARRRADLPDKAGEAMQKKWKTVFTVIVMIYEFWAYVAMNMTPNEMLSRTSLWAHTGWVQWCGIALLVVCVCIWFGGGFPIGCSAARLLQSAAFGKRRMGCLCMLSRPMETGRPPVGTSVPISDWSIGRLWRDQSRRTDE